MLKNNQLHSDDLIVFLALKTIGTDLARATYVDIGAYEPEKYSITHPLYLKGAKGIIVEPVKEFADKFATIRPNDFVFNTACVEDTFEGDVVKFLEYKDEELDVCSQIYRKDRDEAENKTYEVPVIRFSEVMDKAYEISDGQVIDFMSIDVEGYEEPLLESWTAELHPVKLLLLETYKHKLEGHREDLVELMKAKGYTPILRTHYNTLFVNNVLADYFN